MDRFLYQRQVFCGIFNSGVSSVFPRVCLLLKTHANPSIVQAHALAYLHCSSPQSERYFICFACAGEEVSVTGLLEVRIQVVEGLREKPGDKYLMRALEELDEAIVSLGGELPE